MAGLIAATSRYAPGLFARPSPVIAAAADAVMVSVATALCAVVLGMLSSRAAALTPPYGLAPLGFVPPWDKTSCSCSHSRMYLALCWSRLRHLALLLMRQLCQPI